MPKLNENQKSLFMQSCALFCSNKELRSILNFATQDELEEAVEETYGKPFAEARDDFQTVGKQKLRAAQMKAALDGSIPMMIFLGKNWLGQSDAGLIEPPEEKQKEVTPVIAVLNNHANRRQKTS